MKIWRHLTDRSLILFGLLLSVALLSVAPRVYASDDFLDGRYDRLSDSAASAVATHQIGLTMSNTTVPVGSISMQFCANSPIIGESCTPPAGLDASGVVLAAQQGQTGFSVSGSSTADHIILTRPAALPTVAPAVYDLQNIINPSSDGSYYVRLETFTSTDATGLNVEQGGVVFAIGPAFVVTAVVPPYLRFCAAVTITGYDCSSAGSYFIDMGEFSAKKTTAASSEFVAATNAQYGYSVTISGTTLTSGNNVIPALLPAAGSVPGTGQFGVNLRANSTPAIGADPSGPGLMGAVAAAYNVPNTFRFQNGDAVVQSAGASDNQKFTVSYITNIDSAQPAGYYVTTMTYICLANF